MADELSKIFLYLQYTLMSTRNITSNIESINVVNKYNQKGIMLNFWET